MKRLILTVALLGICPLGAHADVPVIDFAGLSAQIKSFAESAKQTVLQNAVVANTLDTVHTAQGILRDTTGTLQEVTSLYGSVTGVRSIGQGVSLALGRLGIQDPLPYSVGSVSGLMNSRNPMGLISSLGALGSSYTADTGYNTIWHPSDPNSDGAQAMTARIGVVSAAQGTGETMFTAAQNRMPLLRNLTDQVNNAKDGAEREVLLARLQGETALTQAATNEAISAQMMA
ncbi:MAG TPA: type IV secretion system protein, partial [Pseudolysinimonas sp.]